MQQIFDTTICAISTPPGTGGIAVARISGQQAFNIVDKLWRGRPLINCKDHTIHFGDIYDTDNTLLDTAVAAVFHAPHSYTGENTVELTVHGSIYIQQQLIQALTEVGATPAAPGEFTRRAFINGKLDLTEAEAVADMIAADSKAAHTIAAGQLKGQLAETLHQIRTQLIEITALLELELDFSEEDVQFASRERLLQLTQTALNTIDTLNSTFKAGNAIKTGIPTVIAGSPNAGKSTLLNTLLKEDRAIVSPISGTTRDTIEATLKIDGITFRLIDTAGLKDNTCDAIENIGIQRAKDKIATAAMIIWLIDPSQPLALPQDATTHIIPVINKTDLYTPSKELLQIISETTPTSPICISALNGKGITTLQQTLSKIAKEGLPDTNASIITNARHHAALTAASEALSEVMRGLNEKISSELLAPPLHIAIDHIGEITGEITTTDILSTIFSRFCIGK